MPRPKTRSKGNESKSQDDARPNVEEEPAVPLRVLILPEHISPDARIGTLPHPRTSQPSRYYFCPEKGIFEFIRIASPKTAHHSWLIGRQEIPSRDTSKISAIGPDKEASIIVTKAEVQEANIDVRPVADGYVVKTPEMLVATPIDAMFLIIPLLLASSGAKSPSSKGVFLSSDDIFDPIRENSPQVAEMLDQDLIQRSLVGRMRAICDTVDAGGEVMFRLNTDRLLEELIAKAKKTAESGLPPSMETKFVRKALEKPIMAIKREDSTISESAQPASDEAVTKETSISESTESQTSTSTADCSNSARSADTDITVPEKQQALKSSQDIEQLMRLRVALSYMLSSYLPKALVGILNSKLEADHSPLDFKPLEKELALVNSMRREALASRSFGDFSRKRGMEDEEAAEGRAEKKAKKEEEEKKRKASETRGVRDLKKVNVSGMKKMSDFFGKKPATSKKA